MESEELLQRMDQDMVTLETTPQDAELLNRIFRALHTIKGTSGFLGFEPVVRLSHRAEDVLERSAQGGNSAQPAHDGRPAAGARPTGPHAGRYPRRRAAANMPSMHWSRNWRRFANRRKPQRVRARTPMPQQSLEPGARSGACMTATAHERKVGAAGRQKMASAGRDAGGSSAQVQAESSPARRQTMRVDVRKLDELINLVGELVLERNRLMRLTQRSQPRAGLTGEDLYSALSRNPPPVSVSSPKNCRRPD